MNAIKTEENRTNLDRYTLSLQNEVKNYTEYKENQVVTFNFKSKENEFFNISTKKWVEELKWFKILSKLQRFFYTFPNDEWKKETYITNVILDKTEKLSFYKDWVKFKIFWKEDFSYDELTKQSIEVDWMNKKIIVVWILDWKLTKVETSYTSETPLKEYMSKSEWENTVDIKWEERKWRKNSYRVLSFRKSEEQKVFKNEELMEFLQKLDEDFKRTNEWLAKNDKKDEVIVKEENKTDIQIEENTNEMKTKEEVMNEEIFNPQSYNNPKFDNLNSQNPF